MGPFGQSRLPGAGQDFTLLMAPGFCFEFSVSTPEGLSTAILRTLVPNTVLNGQYMDPLGAPSLKTPGLHSP